MFLKTEERPQGETQIAPVKGKLRLSEAIRIGAKDVVEYRNSYDSCALGTACYAITGKTLYESVGEHSYPARIPYCQFLARETGTPFSIVEEVHYRHCEGESRESIADWLASQGL